VRLRKYVFGAAALALVSGTVVVSLSGIASASSSVRNPPTVTANGSVACGSNNGTTAVSGIKGTITFVPPLVNGGTASETTSVKIKLSHCTITNNTNLAHGGILTGKVKQSISSPTSTNSCTGLGTSAPESLKVKWTYKSSGGVVLDIVNPTTISYPGYTTNSSTNPPWASSGNAGFQLPGSPSTGTPSGVGSFTNGTGHASQAEAYLHSTETQILTACAGAGYSSDTFDFGQSSTGP